MNWRETDRGDQRCRRLADRHYTRQTPGAAQWARPGWTQVLWTETRRGQGVFCWWRPKWESGLPGTERKDGLRAIECIIFRNKTGLLSSMLIREAVACVLSWEHALDVAWPDGLITGVNSAATAAGRSRKSLPGKCFRDAGWTDFPHAVGRADTWLRYTEPLPAAVRPAPDLRGALTLPGLEVEVGLGKVVA